MNIEQIADSVSQEMLIHVATLQPELVKWNREFLRRCLSKLAEHDVDPVAVVDDIAMHNDGYRIFNGIGEVDTGQRLYTEAQLLAEQLRTAKACAKVSESDVEKQHNHINDGKPFIDKMHWEDIFEAIRNGEWRKYL